MVINELVAQEMWGQGSPLPAPPAGAREGRPYNQEDALRHYFPKDHKPCSYETHTTPPTSHIQSLTSAA